MGKIADRFSHKSDPLYPRAKAIVQAAIRLESASDESEEFTEFDDLADKVKDALKTLDAEKFDKLLSLVDEQVAPRRDADSIRAELFALLEDTCQCLSASTTSEAAQGHLIAIPLALESTRRAWDLLLPQDGSRAIEAICKKFDLVAEDSSFTFVPRILSTLEADYLAHVDVYNLMTALSRKQPDEALLALAGAQERVGYTRKPSPPPQVGVEALSFGLLVAFVETKDSEPFPLLSGFNSEVDDYARDEDESESAVDAPELEAAEQDVAFLLDAAGSELARLLGCSSVRVLSPAIDWFTATQSAKIVERESATLILLRLLAEEFAQGDVPGLVVSLDCAQPGFLEEGLAFHVYKRATGKFLRELRWRPFANESLEEAFENLAQLLKSTGLMQPNEERAQLDAPPAQVAPSGRTRTFH